MNSHRSGAYHHGNLRRALLDAGWALVEEQGPDALTLRALARSAGVSHAAPAHHFPDKARLVEAMALEGWERFTAGLEAAWQDGDPPPPGGTQGRLAAVGAAYVAFATTHPQVFRLMNRPELRADTDGAVAAAAGQARDVLARAVRAAQDDGLVPAGDPTPWALLCWTGVHGMAMLAMDGLMDLLPGGGRDVADATDLLLWAMAHGLVVRDQEQLSPPPPAAAPAADGGADTATCSGG